MNTPLASKTVIGTLHALRHVAEASGHPVTVSADNISDILQEIEGRGREITLLRTALGNLYIAEMRVGAVDADIRFAMNEAGRLLDGKRPQVETPDELRAGDEIEYIEDEHYRTGYIMGYRAGLRLGKKRCAQPQSAEPR
jgi:hypothetical protein